MFAATVIVLGSGCAPRTAPPETAPETGQQAAAVPAEVASGPVMPPFRESEEATAAQLGRALDEGKAARAEVEWVEREEAAASGDVAAGEYLVTYLVTPVDDYYDLEAAQSSQPAHHTTVLPRSAHVAVVIRDAADGRMVQGLRVLATLRPESGEQAQTTLLPYGWHPILNRYGENMTLPSGQFTLSIRITAPTYARQDSINGNRFGEDVIARFTHILVTADSLATTSQRLARGDTRQATELAHREGDAAERPIITSLRSTGTTGSQVRSGNYKVAVLVGQARGRWELRGGKLSYTTPDSSSEQLAHIAVSIRDAASGRFVPGLNVRATVLNSKKKEVNTYALPFIWHPWMNQYGANIPEPKSGRYTIRVRADAPAFRRFGTTALKQFNRGIDVNVSGVRLGR
jgi:uncharacterized protein involved in high-affinity Fe2+ transport